MYCIRGGNERLWNPSWLTEIRFDQGRTLENPGCRHKEINKENLQDSLHIYWYLWTGRVLRLDNKYYNCFPKIWSLSQFSQNPLKILSSPNNRKQSREHYFHILNRLGEWFLIICWVMDVWQTLGAGEIKKYSIKRQLLTSNILYW